MCDAPRQQFWGLVGSNPPGAPMEITINRAELICGRAGSPATDLRGHVYPGPALMDCQGRACIVGHVLVAHGFTAAELSGAIDLDSLVGDRPELKDRVPLWLYRMSELLMDANDNEKLGDRAREVELGSLLFGAGVSVEFVGAYRGE